MILKFQVLMFDVSRFSPFRSVNANWFSDHMPFCYDVVKVIPLLLRWAI
jgi:hypothetical protein